MIFPESYDVFLCANGFHGFRSSMNEHFRSDDYLRIFNLKGGPGTGKSTLLKAVADYGEKRGLSVGRIRCSSDSHSLDGVILEGEKGRVGLVDATAPHTRDEVIPGAVDTTVFLGEYRDDSFLRRMRKDIFALNRESANEFAVGYGYLRISSVFDSYIRADYEESLNRNAVEDFLLLCYSHSFSSKITENAPIENLLISSFGKDGHLRTDGEKDADYTLSGDEGLCRYLLSAIADEARGDGRLRVRYPSPLTPADSDRLILDQNTSIAYGIKGKEDLPCSDYLADQSFTNSPRVQSNLLEKNRALEKAKDHFAVAFQKHLELEEIYRSAMDFSEVTNRTKKILDEIDTIL